MRAFALAALVAAAAAANAPRAAVADSTVVIKSYAATDYTCSGAVQSENYLFASTDNKCTQVSSYASIMANCSAVTTFTSTDCSGAGVTTLLPQSCVVGRNPLTQQQEFLTFECGTPATDVYHYELYTGNTCDKAYAWVSSGWGPLGNCVAAGFESDLHNMQLVLGQITAENDVNVTVSFTYYDSCTYPAFATGTFNWGQCSANPAYSADSLIVYKGNPFAGAPTSSPIAPATDSPHTVTGSPSTGAPTAKPGVPTQAPTFNPVKAITGSGDPHFIWQDMASSSSNRFFDCQTPGWITLAISSSWLIEFKNVVLTSRPYVSVIDQVRISSIDADQTVITLDESSWSGLAGVHGTITPIKVALTSTTYEDTASVTGPDFTLSAQRYKFFGSQQVMSVSMFSNAATGGMLATAACPGGETIIKVTDAVAGRRLDTTVSYGSYSVTTFDNGTQLITVPENPACAAAGLVEPFLTQCHLDVTVSGDASYVNATVSTVSLQNATVAQAKAEQIQLQKAAQTSAPTTAGAAAASVSVSAGVAALVAAAVALEAVVA